jgi:hypothetical protein
MTLYVQVGPFSDPKDPILHLHARSSPGAQVQTLFMGHSCAPAGASYLGPGTKGRQGHVLAHPDFDIQNVIVSEEGELRGLIDWDGVAALPG